MIYNMTEKLKFDSDPVLKIRDTELTIKSDAETVLQLLDVVTEKGEIAAARACMDLLLSPEDQKKLKALGLITGDYVSVMETAMALALGEDPDEGKQGE